MLRLLAFVLLAFVLLAPVVARSADPVREPWTASRLSGSPETPPPYEVERVCPDLGFDQGLELLGGVGLGRFFVTERFGKMWSFREDGTSEKPDLFADLKALHAETDALYNIAFHPRFRENGEVFLFYAAAPQAPDGSRVSRFKLGSLEPPAIDPASEEILLTFRCGGHNGGHMLFGPDGFLYVSAGDMGDPFPPDPWNTGQDLTDLAASIIRIDVDHKADGLAYAIPKDNPFVGMSGMRPEIYAYGFRNPWKMCFRPEKGDLLVGDVGWEMWEMLDKVAAGDNFGWPLVEGPQPVRSTDRPGPTPIVAPLLAYPHSEGASITGGYFWESRTRLPELQGLYLFGDWVSGKIWSFDADSRERKEIADSALQIVSFGRSDSGEIFALDFGDKAGLYRLVPTREKAASAAFPRKLSETGLFADTANGKTMPGVYPFEPVAPRWHDGATAERWIALPGTSTLASFREQSLGMTIPRTRAPEGAVFAKTLRRAERRIETQVLVFEGRDCAAYTYRWNGDQSDAELVPKDGEDRDGWHFSSRADCLRCHNPFAGPALGATPGQLDREVAFNGETRHQLDLFHALGLIDKGRAENRDVRPLVPPSTASAPVAERARSWLHANCAHCHRNGGGGSVTLLLNIEAPDDAMHALGERPLRGDFSLAAARIIAPGAPFRSALFYRAATSGQGHMPIIGPRHPDPAGLRVLHDWIASLRGGDEAPSAPVTDALTKLYPYLSSDTTPPAEMISGLREENLPAIEGLIARFARDGRVERFLALEGDAGKGQTVFASLCAPCHRVRGSGIDVGPDLTFSASRLTRREWIENILHPGLKIDPLYAARTLTMDDGSTLTGIPSEAGTRLKLPGLPSPLSVDPAKIRADVPLPVSLMPVGLLESLSEGDAAALLAYLSTLR